MQKSTSKEGIYASRVKDIRGVCSFIITLKETTSESNKKLFTYKLNEKKKPIS